MARLNIPSEWFPRQRWYERMWDRWRYTLFLWRYSHGLLSRAERDYYEHYDTDRRDWEE